MTLDWLPVCLSLASVIVGIFFFIYFGKKRTGLQVGAGTARTKNSRLLQAAVEQERITPKDDGDSSIASDMNKKAKHTSEHLLHEDDSVSTSHVTRCQGRYAFAKPHVLPPRLSEAGVEIWEICSVDDATAVLTGCPLDSMICCGFFVSHKDGMIAQRVAVEEIAAAQPAGFVFASVNVLNCREVAAWAGVGIDSPIVRIMQPDGVVVADFQPLQIKQGLLHRKILSIAAGTAKSAEAKLRSLSERFKGALCSTPVFAPCAKTGIEKMRSRGIEILDSANMTGALEESFTTLCNICENPRSARVRDVASLAKLVRDLPSSDLLPFLDLARRLAEQKALGGTDPGAAEAMEMLLDSILCAGFDAIEEELSLAMLALQFVVNCYYFDNLHEALLPIVGTLVRSQTWARILQASDAQAGRVQEAAIQVLLNSSISLRVAACRAEHNGILQASIDYLFHKPEHEQLNLAVGNLLAVGGTADNAKRVLQAQPRPTLRPLAAALFRGEMDGPDGCAFPLAWQPEVTPTAVLEADTANRENMRRPPRGRIPARHRSRGGG